MEGASPNVSARKGEDVINRAQNYSSTKYSSSHLLCHLFQKRGRGVIINGDTLVKDNRTTMKIRVTVESHPIITLLASLNREKSVPARPDPFRGPDRAQIESLSL